MKWTTLKVTTALLLAIGFAAPLEAQSRRDRGDDHRYGERQEVRGGQKDRDGDYSRTAERRSDRDDRWDDDDRYEEYERRERGNGPAFCRSGAGHPVFGWEWCEDRGWDRANRSYPVRWERRTWEDVIFRRTDRSGSLDRRDLGDVLGSVIFGRLDARRRELGTRDSYRGEWLSTRSGRELLVTAGGIPLARLIDRDGDRHVDSIYLAER